MIDKIKTLLNKTNELEDEIEQISETSNEKTETSNYVTFTKNLLNYSILTTQKVQIAQIEVIKNSSIYFQILIDVNLTTSQKVTFSLIVDNISIYKSTKTLSNGFNQISIMKAYNPLISTQSDIYIEITPTENKLVTLSLVSLSVWGLIDTQNNIKYQAIETENNILLAYLNNYQLFYKEVDKTTGSFNSEDFNLFKSAKSFLFAYNSQNKILLLFRVDTAGNLFYSNFNDKNEVFVSSGVQDVSACTDNSSTLITFIKNQKCYFVILNNNLILSDEKLLYNNNYKLKFCYAYFNNFNQKFYVITTDENDANFLIESQNETLNKQENINANISLTISTYGD